MRSVLPAFAMLATFWLAGCGGKSVPPTISDLVLGKMTLKPNETGTGTLKIKDPDGDLGSGKIRETFTHSGGTTISGEAALQGARDGITETDGVVIYGLVGAAPTGTWTLAVQVIDNAVNASNTLSATFTLSPP